MGVYVYREFEVEGSKHVTIESVVRIMKRHKLKHTGRREEMIRVFQKTERKLTAEEIVQEMRKQFPGITLETISSNLEAFVRAGILLETCDDGKVRYSLAAMEYKATKKGAVS